jgi:hypothetical protein
MNGAQHAAPLQEEPGEPAEWLISGLNRAKLGRRGADAPTAMLRAHRAGFQLARLEPGPGDVGQQGADRLGGQVGARTRSVNVTGAGGKRLTE